MISGLSLERLVSFLEVADAGGFSRAAKNNPVRQSQLSHQISQLEAAFGGRKLVERHGRGIKVTDAGERLAEVVRVMMQGFDDVQRGEGDEPLRFTLGAGDSLLQWWVVPRLGDLGKHIARTIPTLRSLSSKDIVAQLEAAQLDLGIVRAGDLSRQLVSRPLGEIEYALYVPRKLMPRPMPDDVGALIASVPLALQQSEPELNDSLLALAGKRRPIEAALACETFPQACRAVRSGRYAALLPTIVEHELPSRDVEEVKHPKLARLSMRLLLAWHPRTTRRSARHAALVEALEDLLMLRDE